MHSHPLAKRPNPNLLKSSPGTPRTYASNAHYRLRLKGLKWFIERTAIDIVVGNKVAIEIKVSFNRTNEFHRLKGQLEDYAREFSRIVIVLCGELDDDLVDKLEDTLPADTKIRIIEK